MRAAQCGLLLALGLAGLPMAGADWPQWLGPNRDSLSPERGPLLARPRPLWTNQVGLGCSSVVVSQGRVFAMGHVKGLGRRGTDTVFCLDARTGAVLWQHSYDSLSCFSQDVQFDGPRATPTVDGRQLFTLGLEGQLFCFDAASGRVVWARHLQRDFEGRIPVYGYCGSPLLYRDLVLLELNAPKASYLALAKHSGQVVWRAAGGQVTCGSPVLTQMDGQDCAVFLGGAVVLGLDPATGRELWRHGTWGHAWMGQVVWSNLVFVANASLPRGCGLLRIERGRPRVLWEDRHRFQTLHSNALLWQGHLYGLDNTGTDLQNNDNSRSRLKCLLLETGQQKWSRDRFGWSNVIFFDGWLLVLRQVGELVIVRATPDGYQELARHQVLDGRSWTVPALADGRLYCRNNAGSVVCWQIAGQ